MACRTPQECINNSHDLLLLHASIMKLNLWVVCCIQRFPTDYYVNCCWLFGWFLFCCIVHKVLDACYWFHRTLYSFCSVILKWQEFSQLLALNAYPKWCMQIWRRTIPLCRWCTSLEMEPSHSEKCAYNISNALSYSELLDGVMAGTWHNAHFQMYHEKRHWECNSQIKEE